MRAQLFAAISLFFVGALVGCTGADQSAADSGSPGESGCPRDLPASCPPAVPSYQADVASIIQRRCLSCHGNGGVAAGKFNFTTYGQVFAARSTVLNQVYGCVMPPLDAGQLTPDERATLLAWLVCHAPNN